MKIPLTFRFILALFTLFRCFKYSHNTQFFTKVSGKPIKVLDKYVYPYLGIPYAVPPVGELRFQEPKQIKSWISSYNKTQKPPSCMQDPVYPSAEWLNRYPKDVSEDCLYLNVWVPSCESDEEPLATMVWIYGGSFNTGSTAMNVYDGAILASVGNVIIVTFNYRVGAFGYANFNKENARGNMGMLDQVMALKWVHRNIEAFGGDRHRITIFGESAGSISAAHHLISPLTKGLFSRAILQSGSNYHKDYTVKPEVNVKLTALLSTELECHNNGMLDCMRKLNAADIAFAEKKLLNKLQSVLSFMPEKRLPFLPENPLRSIESGKFHDVEVLIGETMNEGSFFLRLYKPELLKDNSPILTKTEAKYILSKFFKTSEEFLDRISEMYFANVSDDDHLNIVKQTVEAMGHGAFICPNHHLGEKLAVNNRKVYHYTFNHTRIRSKTPEWMGVPHFADVPYVFGMPFVRKDDYTEEEVQFSRRLIELWTSFAKTGLPEYEGMEHEWKPFDQQDRHSFYLTLGNFHPTKAKEEKCTVWKDFINYNYS